MIVYIENLKYATKKWIELINKFTKLAGYKINIQKPVVFLYMNNKLSERGIKKTIPYTIATKRIKYIGVNCTLKTIRHWWKKLKMTQTNGKIYCGHELEELILLKWTYYLRQFTDLIQSLSKCQEHFSQN